MFNPREDNPVEKRLQSLEAHLREENPALLGVVKSFRTLDEVARQLGFFNHEESFAIQIAWWPIVSILGTYSSGKSTFINDYLEYKLQLTGNQAVDDKFTVICYSKEPQVRVLPGLALDADPRFPFYKVSDAIEKVAPGEGRRIDAYLQLKTCPCEKIKGKVFIDSPGFDADAQRTAVLRITDYIIDLSDLVLVFFDARHPEAGTMQDTLKHLVGETIKRPDSNKFLYILNQIDTTALEDNPEDVVGSWQRALAQYGLTAGRFYRIFSKNAAIPIPDPKLKARFEAKREEDIREIYGRIEQVEVERAYRIVGLLEKTAHRIEEKIVPRLQELIAQWRRRVLWMDGGILAVFLLVGAVWERAFGFGFLAEYPSLRLGAAAALVVLFGYLHFSARKLAANQIIHRLQREIKDKELQEHYIRAFQKNTRWYRSIFSKRPAGWNARAQQKIKQVLLETGEYIQMLNDRFTNPSGEEPSPAAQKEEAIADPQDPGTQT
ncbi:MAG: dynamin family protein [Gammaproteobacteria bacterium]|nr:MAG: dynamin family protein [Gammaproteobacteria bacterium]